MWWNNVETKPYGGYPQHWDVKHPGHARDQATPVARTGTSPRPIMRNHPMARSRQDDLRGRSDSCRTRRPARRSAICRPTRNGEPPTSTRTRPPAQVGRPAVRRLDPLPEHHVWFFHLARICNHCTYPACLAACPRNAIYKRPEDGIVLIDQEPLPRLSQVRRGVSLQEGLLSRHHPHQRKVHRLLSADRGQGPPAQPGGPALRNPVHGGLRRQDPTAGVGQDRRRRRMDQGPSQSDRLPGP